MVDSENCQSLPAVHIGNNINNDNGQILRNMIASEEANLNV